MDISIGKRQFKGDKSLSSVYVIFYLFVVGLFVLAPAGNVKVVYPSEQEVVRTADTDREVSPAKEEPNQRFVEIDFDNVDILLFVKFVSEATGKNFVVDPKVIFGEVFVHVDQHHVGEVDPLAVDPFGQDGELIDGADRNDHRGGPTFAPGVLGRLEHGLGDVLGDGVGVAEDADLDGRSLAELLARDAQIVGHRCAHASTPIEICLVSRRDS